MTTHEQAAHYARAGLHRCPPTADEILRDLTAASGRLLVLLEANVVEREEEAPGFRKRLEEGPLARLAEFPREGGGGYERVWVYRSR